MRDSAAQERMVTYWRTGVDCEAHLARAGTKGSIFLPKPANRAGPLWLGDLIHGRHIEAGELTDSITKSPDKPAI